MTLGHEYQEEELYKHYLIHDLGVTLTYVTTRSTYVAHAFELGRLLKCDLKGKTCKNRANG